MLGLKEWEKKNANYIVLSTLVEMEMSLLQEELEQTSFVSIKELIILKYLLRILNLSPFLKLYSKEVFIAWIGLLIIALLLLVGRKPSKYLKHN